MNTVNENFLLSLAIIAIGYIAKRSGLVSIKEGQTLNKIILNITLPALILHVFSDIDLSLDLLWLAVIAIIFGVAMLWISSFIFKTESAGDRGVLILATLGFNIGLFAYPFVESIWGTKGLQYMAIFDIGNAFIIFGLAYAAAIIYSPENKEVDFRYILKRLATFIPLLSYLAALGLGLSGITLPAFGTQLLEKVSSANAVLVLLVLGIYLDFSLDRTQLSGIFKAVLVKYTAGITAGILLYIYLPFDDLFKATILLGLVLPTGMAIIPYAVANKLNEKIAGGVVNLTNIISFIIMWVIFMAVH